MTKSQHIAEGVEIIQGVIERWCPEFSRQTESREQQVMRVLLAINAYELCAKESLAGKRPMRTDFPLPLPKP